MIEKNGNTFCLSNNQISYIMVVGEKGDLLHYYYGTKIPSMDYSPYHPEWALWTRLESEGYTLEFIEQEYPGYGHIDLRAGVYQAVYEDQSAVTRLIYKDYERKKGAVGVKGMPTIYGEEAQTLIIQLLDEVTGLIVKLYYTIFKEYNVIIRKTEFINQSEQQIVLSQASSASLDLPVNQYEVIHLAGSWARECDVYKNNLTAGSLVEIASARGGSSHQVNPFVMVCEDGAGEEHGEVFGFSLIYSGDHSTKIAMDQHGGCRICMGIHPDTFQRTLKPKDSFFTPECVLAYSKEGFGKLSREYHRLYQNQLSKSKRTHEPRPVLINNWEGTYFDFDEEKLLKIARKAKEAGVELFVLDDGWFGQRKDDLRSLGDWYVNTDKLPDGIEGIAKKINDLGMEFGLWFEPEMVNPDSDLYRTHPDWVIHTEKREPSLSRNQLMLDLSKREVCEYIIERVCDILGSSNISYVKWDMNRNMADRPYIGYNYDYIMGLYYVMETITNQFPEVLFEGCASGGGRFDPGILAYMPQIWTSDNTDAISRMKTQYGTSLVYPLSAISAHVTIVPNHQTNRVTPLNTRAAVAFTGAFGYEMDLNTLTEEEFLLVQRQVKQYKNMRSLFQNGLFYRLLNPFTTNYCGWQVINQEKSEAFVMAGKILTQINTKDKRLKLKGLKEEAMYQEEWTGETVSGASLMYRGIDIIYEGKDFTVETFHFTEITR